MEITFGGWWCGLSSWLNFMFSRTRSPAIPDAASSPPRTHALDESEYNPVATNLTQRR